MTIKDLISNCENIFPDMEIMLYDSNEDFEHATCNWKSCRAASIADYDIKIGKFRIYDTFVAVALA